MEYAEAKKRLLAAQTLLLEPATSFEKFASVKMLLTGVHPRLDEFLARAAEELAPIEKILGGDYVLLTIENLPEATEEHKKKKKAILFFWKTWNTLKSEVSRVQAEMHAAQNAPDQVTKSSHWGRIFNFAKGPFGILTVAAVALASASAVTSVEISIKNQNCPTMVPSSSMPIPLPGISFPKDPIPKGGTGKASIPGVPVTVDGTQKGTLLLSSIKLHMSFQLGAIKSVTFDGVELLGKKTDINLSEKKSHEMVFTCS